MEGDVVLKNKPFLCEHNKPSFTCLDVVEEMNACLILHSTSRSFTWGRS